MAPISHCISGVVGGGEREWGEHVLQMTVNLYQSMEKFSCQQIDSVFFIFLRKYALTFHADCLPLRQLA